MQIRRALCTVGCAALVIAITSCGDATGPTAPSPSRWLFPSQSAPSLIECPSSTTLQTRSTIGILGGVLSLGGTRVSIPLGALLEPTEIVLTIPASRYMEIDVSVTGVDHFLFEKNVVVTMDYSRCGLGIFHPSLKAWHIDSDSKALLEQMPSFDSKLTQTVIFSTGHLSGYALAD